VEQGGAARAGIAAHWLQPLVGADADHAIAMLSVAKRVGRQGHGHHVRPRLSWHEARTRPKGEAAVQVAGNSAYAFRGGEDADHLEEHAIELSRRTVRRRVAEGWGVWGVCTMALLTIAPLTMAPLTMAPLTMAPLTMAPLTMIPLTMAQLNMALLTTTHTLLAMHLIMRPGRDRVGKKQRVALDDLIARHELRLQHAFPAI
jgi:hypothetical protein